MRTMTVFALSAATFLLPAIAAADPAQNSAAATQQAATTTSTVVQTPQATQAPAAAPQPGVAATAQTGPENVVVRPPDSVDLDQVVCKAEPPSIGSRLGGGRECHTQREWNRRMRESQDITRRQQIMGFHQ
ncbi:MAG TPA: hypothetical protein VKR31_17805 [Rhizomicrobium sp.]|nr:hypothetical protein [Rhizomicrobium sp.]